MAKKGARNPCHMGSKGRCKKNVTAASGKKRGKCPPGMHVKKVGKGKGVKCVKSHKHSGKKETTYEPYKGTY